MNDIMLATEVASKKPKTPAPWDGRSKMQTGKCRLVKCRLVKCRPAKLF